MATKTIAWKTGSGAITLTYTGQGNDSISVASDENDSFDERSQSFDIVTTAGSPEKAISILVKQQGKKYAVGEVFNFDYTGSVQEITLPKGKYKLQCWGAQGGNVTGTYAVNGSKGGYSEGVLTLTKTTTLYVFVGGQGTAYTSTATQTTTTVLNGGWNGGGAGRRTSRYNSGDTDGRSFPRGGGGATDISTVTSALSYSSGRTTRDSASLLARCIVAGGGAGASARHTSKTTTTTTYKALGTFALDDKGQNTGGSYYHNILFHNHVTITAGKTYRISLVTIPDVEVRSFGCYLVRPADGGVWNNGNVTGEPFIVTAATTDYLSVVFNAMTLVPDLEMTIEEQISTTSTSTSNGKSSAAKQGGGTSGKGQYPGTQTSAGSGGAFGLGANQSSTNYRYCGGGGGGGWYGGGTNNSDSSTNYINYSGGGSGFVNTAANAASRPSGYTGLQLDSGTTKDGSKAFESISGGTETGHSGNGYARITVLSDKEPIPSEYTELAYIESNDSQYIDTGFKPNNNTRVVMDAQFVSLPTTINTLFGARTSATSKNYAFLHTNSRVMRSDYNNVYTQTWESVGVERFVVNKNKETTTLHNESQSYTNSTFQCDYNMYLCASNHAGSVSWHSSIRLYSCQIYDNGTLVRDYVPVKDKNGVCGLYDKVNGTFNTSASGTDFTGA